MAELVLIQHAPWNTPGVPPVIQWGRLAAQPGDVKQVALMGGDTAMTRKYLRKRLPKGTPVLLGPERARAVVVEFDSEASAYAAYTAAAAYKGISPGKLWPDPHPWPLLGAATAPSASAALSVHSNDARRARLRGAAARFRAATLADGLSGATWIDADLVPHQVAAVERVLTSPDVRHLLADEVGLGKTVEALLIWSALQAGDPTLRTLIVAPRSLVPQWAFEIQRRATRALGKWYEGLPRVFVAQAEAAFEAFDAPEPSRPVVTEFAALEGSLIPPSAVDLLIIDEAHALTEPQRAGVERLSAGAQHILLLTATPRRQRRLAGVAARKSLGDNSFAWALSVVDPRLAGDVPACGEAMDQVAALNTLAREILQQGSADAAEALSRRLSEALHAPKLADGAPAVDLVRAAAVALAPFDRVVRTRRRDVNVGLGRRALHEWPLDYRREELHLLSALEEWFEDAVETGEAGAASAKRRAASSWAALRREIPSELHSRLVGLGDADARLEAVLDLVGAIWAEDPSRRIVIRADYAETRSKLRDRLQDLLLDDSLRATSPEENAAWDGGVIGPVAVVERGQESLVDTLARLSAGAQEDEDQAGGQDTILRNLVEFTEGHAVVLVADDTAETGLNLQHASDLIFVDLPTAPGAVEQWIGRLDRLGRAAGDPVRIHVLAHPASPDAPLIGLYKALGVFDRGYQVPPEVAAAVDGLIAKADMNQIPWRDAIGRARAMVEDATNEEQDVLLDAIAPDQARAERALGAREERVHAAREYFHALGGIGFEVGETQGDRACVSWGNPALGLRELREKMAPRLPKFPGQRGFPGLTLNVPLRPRPLGSPLTRGTRMLFSPRHPLFGDVWDELSLEAGAHLTFLSAPRPAQWSNEVGSYAALVQTRTFPEAQGEAALFRVGAARDFGLTSLARLRKIVCSSVGRMCSAAAPPQVERRVYSVHSSGNAVFVRPMREPDALFEQLLANACAASPAEWTEAALRQIEATMDVAADLRSPPDLTPALARVRAFLAHRRAFALKAAEKTITDKEHLVRTTGGQNAGFVKMLDAARKERQVVETFFEELTMAVANDAAIAEGAVRAVVTDVVFVRLTERT